jgi:hypothetical protein
VTGGALRAGLLVGAGVQFLLTAELARELPALVPLAGLLLAGTIAAAIWAYRPSWQGPLWPVLLSIALLSRALQLWAVPRPGMDTFFVMQKAARLLLSGQDPFLATTVSGVSPAMVSGAFPHLLPLPYWPATVLLSLPAYALLGDVRWADAVASLLPAVAAYRLAQPAGVRAARTLALVVLFMAGTLLVVMQSWAEPLMLGLAALGVMLSLSASSRPLQALCWAGLWATKPSALVLAVPMARRLGLRLLASSLAAAAALCLVFLAWGPHAFWQGPVVYQLASPVRHDALTVTALVYAVTGFELPGLVIAAITAALVAVCALRSDGSWAGALGAAGASQLALFIVNKWGFANYYFLAGGLLWLACAAAIGEPRHASQPAPALTSAQQPQ